MAPLRRPHREVRVGQGSGAELRRLARPHAVVRPHREGDGRTVPQSPVLRGRQVAAAGASADCENV